MKETLVDIETYSEVDIKTCGLYRYATDPSFEILLIAWATDDGSGFGETQCCDLATGDPFPTELLEAFQSGTVRLIAHNMLLSRRSIQKFVHTGGITRTRLLIMRFPIFCVRNAGSNG